MAKYRIYKFAGNWHLYDQIASNWHVLLFSAPNLKAVTTYMDADAVGDYRQCYNIKMASMSLCKGF